MERGTDRHGAEDWQVGDIAECVSDGWLNLDLSSRPGPARRDRHRVTRVVEGKCRCCGGWRPHLVFPAFDGEFYDARAFRKIMPKADEAIAANADFLDRWIKQPETTATLNRWQTFASVAIVAIVTLSVGVESLVAALTRAPA